jgi:WD40 repeat protein
VLFLLKKTPHQDFLPPVHVLEHGGLFRPAAHGGRDLILLALAFSPDGEILASAGGGKPEGPHGPASGEVKLWRVSTGEVLKTMTVENGIVFQMAFSLDGKLLATASGSGSAIPEVPGEVRLWNPVTGELVHKLKGHSGGVYSVAFNPDGKLLASGSMPPLPLPHKELAEIKLWDLTTGKELRTLRGHTGAVGSLAFTADSKTLASGAGLFDGRVKLWDLATGTDLGTLGSKAETAGVMAFIPKTATLAVCSVSPTGKDPGPYKMQVSLWDIREKKQIEAYQITDRFPYRIARSHKGDLIAYTCANGVKVYDVGKQVEVQSLLPSKLRMRPVAFSPDDGLLAAGNDDGTVRIWSVAKLRK